MSDGGRWQAQALPAEDVHAGAPALRVLSAVLLLELIWLLLVGASLLFLAAHLGGGTDEITGDEVSRRMLLVSVPPIALALALGLLGARQAVDRRALSHHASLTASLRAALWVTALANTVMVALIAISLYHARTTWIVVGIALGAGFAAVAVSCIRATRA